MRHPSGLSVYYDAETLTAAPSGERQAMLGTILSGMLDANEIAGNTAVCLANDLTDANSLKRFVPVPYTTETSHGELAVSSSLGLLWNRERLHGFLNAIRRWPEQEGVIDVGCGPFAVLALAAAMYHPRAEVTAIEINPDAAQAAAKITEIFGMSDRVHVVNADIAYYPIDTNTTAAVTETFDAALQGEPGPQIVRLLHENGVTVITPSQAELRLCVPDGAFVQQIDLRRDTHASIDFHDSLECTDNPRWVDLSASYSDDFGIVLPYDADTISMHLHSAEQAALWEVIKQANGPGRLTYELGAYTFQPQLTALEPANI
jgi:SAM-dependent methyltransferase